MPNLLNGGRMTIRQIYKPVILITGCAAGLGLSLAKLLVSTNQYRVVATARSKSLVQLKSFFKESEDLTICELDVTNEKQRNDLIGEIYKK